MNDSKCSKEQRSLLDSLRERRFVRYPRLLSILSERFGREVRDLSDLSRWEASDTIDALRKGELK